VGQSIGSTQQAEWISASSQSVIPASANTLWRFISQPSSAVLLEDSAIRSFQEPGSPNGVGLRYTTVHREINGTERDHRYEVIDFVDGRLATVRSLDLERPSVSTNEVVAVTDALALFRLSISCRRSGVFAWFDDQRLARAVREATSRVSDLFAATNGGMPSL